MPRGLVVPRRMQTLTFLGVFLLGGGFMMWLAIFGDAEDGVFRLFLLVIALFFFAVGGWGLLIGSFRLDGERVHAGWPWSRWIHRDEVERIDFAGTPATGGLVVLELVDGSSVKLAVVNPSYILTRSEVQRIDRSIRRLHRSLGFDY